MTYAHPQMPNGVVKVKLYEQASIDDSNGATRPIKRQPAMGISAYIGDGVIYVPDFNESFTLRLIDIASNVEIFSSTVLLGQTAITIPQDLLGDFFINFDFLCISYRGNIHL